MKTEALAQHRWLQQLVGEWVYDSECEMGPDQPPIKDKGRETVRMFGDLWLIAEGQGGSPGGEWASVITLGYDPKQSCFVGSFIANMMANMWHYKGQLDNSEKVLTLDTEGPNFSDGKLTRFQDIITIVNAEERLLTSQMMGDDQQWHPFMRVQYRRIK